LVAELHAIGEAVLPPAGRWVPKAPA